MLERIIKKGKKFEENELNQLFG